jgi:enterochelin esterase family protein
MSDKSTVIDSISQLLEASLGSDLWWTRVERNGVPLLEELRNNQVKVTFLWRDPSGAETDSAIACVYVDVNSVTDHHSFEPQSLTRISGTDIWWWEATLPADWRGSYCFIPVGRDGLPPYPPEDPRDQQSVQRQWWRSIVTHSIADPLNPNQFNSGWGAYSLLSLPQAPQQQAWAALDRCADPAACDFSGALSQFVWRSNRLGNARDIWLYQTAQVPDLPVVLLLDGQRWARHMPIFSALDWSTAQGDLPPAIYVLIDSINGEQRDHDLPCNSLYWQAVVYELLPLVANKTQRLSEVTRAVVAGQSLGGLAALFAGLEFPQCFSAVVSQSGSFWWPYQEYLQADPGQPCLRKPGIKGELAQRLSQGEYSGDSLCVYLEVGSREDVMIDVNESLRDALIANGHVVRYCEYEGGHDSACWRGGLLEGLSWVLSELN